MKLIFRGAAKQVTGSMHEIITASGFRILLDCGLDYEQQRDFHYTPQVVFPFKPSEVDLLILSHAHIDHSGNIPNLMKQGFKGKIICTPPTEALVEQLLLDSAKIQDYEYRKSKKGKARTPKPMYGEKEVQYSMDHIYTWPFGKWLEINDEVSMLFIEAGHILGAAAVHLTINEPRKKHRLTFTGDWGRNGSELIKDPPPLPESDIILCESTYGGRVHKVTRSTEEELMEYIQDCCIDRMGKLIIPAFSVGRTQSIIFTLHKLFRKGLLPEMPIYVDSPLAIRSTHIYDDYDMLLNEEAREFRKLYGHLFRFDQLKLIEGRDDLLMRGGLTERGIIVSAAGMVEGGRIQQHVANHISNPYATILIAGYCAEGTLGHRLLQGQQFIKIKGRDYPVYARIAQTDVFSSHPDKHQLEGLLTQHKNSDIYLVHGDVQNMNALADSIKSAGCQKVMMPSANEEFEY